MNRVLKVNKVKCLEKRNREKNLKLKELKEKTFQNFRDLISIVKENKNLKKEIEENFTKETKDKINSQNLLFTKELEIEELKKNNKRSFEENKELFKKTNELAENISMLNLKNEEKEKFYESKMNFYKKQIEKKNEKIEDIETDAIVSFFVGIFIGFLFFFLINLN